MKFIRYTVFLLASLPLHGADWLIGDLKVLPPGIVSNVATTIVATVAVPPNPSLIPGSVKLLRLDRYGHPVTVLGLLYDDGTHGDKVAGDGVYSGRFTLTESRGPILVAGGAAFSSGKSGAMSPVLPISVIPPGLVYPLKRSPDQRSLLTQSGAHFLLTGDAPHSMFVNLSVQDAATYISNRASHGVNALWVQVLCNGYTAGRSDGSTYDGILPFTDPSDISTPNESYFARIDSMIRLAGKYHMTVFLDAFETGGWMGFLEAQGNTKAFNWGAYLGNRYKAYPNIVWITGNDFQTWNTSSIDNELIKNIMAGIASVDSSHLQTLQLNYDASGSLDNPLTVPYVALAGAYTYLPTYAEVLIQYNKNPFQPLYLQEAHYDGETVGGCCGETGTPNILRRQAYWSLLSGAVAGQMYGSSIWTFQPGWRSKMDTPGIVQLGVWKAFATSHAWYDLVPDQFHTTVTAGFGTYSFYGALGTNDYVTAARTPDGKTVLAYTPVSHTLTVDMTQMRGPVVARWFDPTNGAYSPAGNSAFPNTGTKDFPTPGSNASGDSDWVLVLESQ
ncbi:MAG: DUF4038 domain-containing protein [Bryobacteraceae bacterium]